MSGVGIGVHSLVDVDADVSNEARRLALAGGAIDCGLVDTNFTDGDRACLAGGGVDGASGK